MIYRRAILILSGAFLLIVAVWFAAVTYFSGDSDYPYMEVTPGAVVPKLSLHKTVRLGRGARGVYAIAFSPNNRYVAIGYSQTVSMPGTSLKIWDLHLDKEQSSFNCPTKIDSNCIQLFGHVLWSQDSKRIFFSNDMETLGTQFDAMTGQILPALPIEGHRPQLNRDGSRMLTITRNYKQDLHCINIYDTQSWSRQTLFVEGLIVLSAVWTFDDKILAGVEGSRQTIGKTIDGFTIAHHVDQAFRLLDPAGKEPPKSIWFPAVPDTRPNYFPWRPSAGVSISVSDLTNGRAVVAGTKIIDTKTMAIFDYLSEEEKQPGKFGWSGGQVFSPDGKYLFTKDAGRFDNKRLVTNAIFDAATGKRLALFGGESGTNHEGIGISPDGKMLALGNVNSVQILKMKHE